MHHADRTAIPGARALFVVLDETHRPEFRRAGDGDRPGMAEEGIKTVHVLAQAAFNVVNRVDEARIHLDLTPPDDAHRARLADAALVVAVHVGAHGQLGLVLFRVEQLQDLLAVGNRILAALDRAGDRAGFDAAAIHPHEHFRRRADQKFLVAQIDEKGIGRRVDGLQTARDLRRLALDALVEHLARHHFEQVAAPEAFLGLFHQPGIFAWRMVAARRHMIGRAEWVGTIVTWQPGRVETGAGKLVAVLPGFRRIMVHDEDFVGQVKHEIALAVRPVQLEGHRIELEAEVIAEGAVEPEIGILVRLEERDNRTQHGEDGRYARALLLGEGARGFADLNHGLARRCFGDRNIRQPLHHGGDGRQHGRAAGVQRLDIDLAAPRRNHQRRIDDRRIPARIAARIFVIGGKDCATAAVETVHIGIDGARIGRRMTCAGNGDSALGDKGFRAAGQDGGGHFIRSVVPPRRAREEPHMKKAARKPVAAI